MEISLSEQKVIVIQEIKFKVRFLSPTRFIYIIEGALKLLLNPELVLGTLV